MLTQSNTENYSTPRQLKLPLEIEKLIDIEDPVNSFSEVMDHIDLTKYFVHKESKTGRPKSDPEVLLKIILFSFMEHGYRSLRGIEKSCKTDIRYIWLLNDSKAPSFATIGNFIRNELTQSIDDIFSDINRKIFELDHVDTEHTYIDGTKIEANANKYTWVWKKSCIHNRDKVFLRITDLINRMNDEALGVLGVKIEIREEYAIEYLEEILGKYKMATGLDESAFVSGVGHKKSIHQKQYQEMQGFIQRLKTYAEHIEICGENRNSYSKTDHDATFMRVKTDYMGNDQLLPSYNLQAGICDEYVAVIDVQQFASDMDCFVPLMEKFHSMYGKYPSYPVADAGYGSFNNYLYCEEKGMKKYMKFPMYEKETKDKKYRDNPYRAINFTRNEEGHLICPNGKRMIFKGLKPVKGNKYDRKEELYVCENCEDCPYKKECCPRARGNRQINLNQELTSIHEEVLENLNCIHGALLCMNRSIQSEGTFGGMKWNRSYKRAYRRGMESIRLEFTLIAAGYNLYKYFNKQRRKQMKNEDCLERAAA